MASEVSMKISATTHRQLHALLQFTAKKISKEQFIAIMIAEDFNSRQFSDENFDLQLRAIAETLDNSIK
jgi:hypothetical protein